MKFRDHLGRILILLVFLGCGIGLIWHIGHNLFPQGNSSVPARATSQPASAIFQTASPDAAIDKPPMASPGDTESDPDSASHLETQPKPTAQIVLEPLQDELASEKSATENESDLIELPPSLQDLQAKSGFPRLSVTEEGWFLVSEPILFKDGDSTLQENSLLVLDGLAAILKEKADIELEIVGHTDSRGNDSTNQRISEERAAATKEYLVSQGIDASRLRSKGMGSQDPIASNSTPEGRQANRRIEFLVVSPK